MKGPDSDCGIDGRVGEKTREYWENTYQSIVERLENYIDKLLILEMECAQQCGRLPSKEEASKAEVLILLVGESIEPLLQSIWVYEPNEILFILNQNYSNEVDAVKMRSNLMDIMTHFNQAKTINPKIRFNTLDEASPPAVFRLLQKYIKKPWSTVIDITGSKKNIVVGAYLFAAFNNIRITYIDFPDKLYDPINRRPYGFCPQIGWVDNPFDQFALRDWVRVRILFQQYKFREAQLLLAGEYDEETHSYTEDINSLLVVMVKYLPESVDSVLRLADIFRCYAYWDSGNLGEAKKLSSKMEGFIPPTAVTKLGESWYIPKDGKFKGGFDQGLPRFYEDTPEFKTYIVDELARIRRLIDFNHDYRSAIIRAGNLNENVMVARLVKILPDGEIKEAILNEFQNHTPGARAVFQALCSPIGTIINIKKEIWRSKVVPTDYEIQITNEMDWYKECMVFGNVGDWNNFICVRDSLTHKYFSPPGTWADDAYQFVRENIVDFYALPEPESENVHSLQWKEVCKISGINDYLIPNLIENL